jgi:hypothetical protein
MFELNSDTTIDNIFCIEKVMQIRDHEYREKILQIAIFFSPNKTSKNITIYEKTKVEITSNIESEDMKTFVALSYALKEKQCADFKKGFKYYVSQFTEAYGSYFEYAFKPRANLLYKIAEQQKLYRTAKFVSMSLCLGMSIHRKKCGSNGKLLRGSGI